MSKKKVQGVLKINVHEVISRAVNEGVRMGYRRAHKHTDTPGEEVICDAIETAVMGSLTEVLEWSVP